MKPSALRHLDDLVLREASLQAVREPLVRLTEELLSVFSAGGSLFLCGNGGSAADADHIVGELQKGFVLPRPVPAPIRAAFVGAGFGDATADRMQQGLRAATLCGSVALATAVMNDNDPVLVFAQPLYALARPGDAVLGITTSGRSPNVIHALRAGRALGLRVLGLAGPERADIDDVAHLVLHAPGRTTHEVQERHRPISHAVCMAVEEELFGR